MYKYAQHSSYRLVCHHPGCGFQASEKAIKKYKDELGIDVHKGGVCPECHHGILTQLGTLPNIGGPSADYDSPNWPKDENGNPLPPYTFDVSKNKRTTSVQTILGHVVAIDANGDKTVKSVPLGTRHAMNDTSTFRVLKRRLNTITKDSTRENFRFVTEVRDVGVSGLTIPPPLKITELSSEKENYVGIDGGFARIFGLYTPMMTSGMSADAYRKKYERVCYQYGGVVPHQKRDGSFALNKDDQQKYEALLRAAAANMKRKLDLGQPVIMDGIKLSGAIMVDEWLEKMISNPGEVYNDVQLVRIKGPFQIKGWQYKENGIGVDGNPSGVRVPTGFEKITTSLMNQTYSVKGRNDDTFVPIPKNVDLVNKKLKQLIAMIDSTDNDEPRGTAQDSDEFKHIVDELDKYMDFDQSTPVDSALLRTNLNMVKVNHVQDNSEEAQFLNMVDAIEYGYSPAVDKIKELLLDNNIVMNVGAESDVSKNDMIIPVNFLRGVNGLYYDNQPQLQGAYYYPSDIEMQIKAARDQNLKAINKYEEKERELKRLTEANPDAAYNPANVSKTRPRNWQYQLDIAMVPRTPGEVAAAIKAKQLQEVSRVMRNQQAYDDFVKSWIVYSGGMSAAEAKDATAEILADSLYDPGPALAAAKQKDAELNEIYQKSIAHDQEYLRDLRVMLQRDHPKQQAVEAQADSVRVPSDMSAVINLIEQINEGHPNSDRMATQLQKYLAPENLITYAEYKTMHGSGRADFDTFTRLLWEWQRPPQFIAEYLTDTKEYVQKASSPLTNRGSVQTHALSELVSLYGNYQIPTDMDKYIQLIKMEKETGVNVHDKLRQLGTTTIKEYLGDPLSEGYTNRINKVITFINSHEQNSIQKPGEATSKVPIDENMFTDASRMLDALTMNYGAFYQKYYANANAKAQEGAMDAYEQLRKYIKDNKITRQQLVDQIRGIGYKTNADPKPERKPETTTTESFDIDDILNML